MCEFPYVFTKLSITLSSIFIEQVPTDLKLTSSVLVTFFIWILKNSWHQYFEQKMQSNNNKKVYFPSTSHVFPKMKTTSQKIFFCLQHLEKSFLFAIFWCVRKTVKVFCFFFRASRNEEKKKLIWIFNKLKSACYPRLTIVHFHSSWTPLKAEEKELKTKNYGQSLLLRFSSDDLNSLDYRKKLYS